MRNLRVVLTVGIAVLAACPLVVGQIYRPCPPGTVPRNPSPVVVGSGPDCLFKVYQGLSLNQEAVRVMRLEKGAGYWFAANGCPKMGVIRLSIVDGSGAVLRQEEEYKPSFCFTPDATGEYTLKVKAVSLMGRSTSGTVDACLSRSGCGK